MNRYLAFPFIIMLLAAGCGQADSVPGTGTPESAGAESTQINTQEPTASATEPEPTTTSTSTPTVTPTPTSDGYEIIAIPPNGTRTESGPRPSVPDIEAPASVTEPVFPTATVAPAPSAEPLVELPPVPEITSCQHAAELTLERLQIFLDVLAPYEQEEIYGPDGPEPLDPALNASLMRISEQLDEIDNRAEIIGCRDTEMQLRIGRGFYDLRAEGSAAEWVLEGMIQGFEDEWGENPPLPTVGMTEIATCEEGVTEFIDATQVLFDSIVGVTIEEAEAEEEGLEEFVETWGSELGNLFDQFTLLSCSGEQVNAMVLERIDELEADGEVARAILDELLVSLENGEFFDGL